jgi:S1-C subfamily serine protease
MQLRITTGADAGKTIEVTGNEFTIGREQGVDLVIADGKASRRHAAIKPLPDGRATIYDLGSSNGTYVNGQRIQSTVLNGNEQVQIGDTTLVPLVGAAAPAGAGGATSVGQAQPAAPPPPAPPQQPAPPTQPLTPGAPPEGQPQGGFQFQTPSAQPVSRPSRTQSAIQRIMLQRAVTRATIVGVVAIVLAIGVGVAAALGVFSGGGEEGPSNADIVQQAEPSTFFVVTNKGDAVGRGTGWVWDASQGLIVTNAHVTAGGSEWVVGSGEHLTIDTEGGNIGVSPNGKQADRIGEAPCEDIAVLKVKDPAGLRDLPRGSQSELRIGDRVIAAGYPSTRNLTESDTFSEPGFTSGDLTAASGDVSQVKTTFQAIPGEGPGDVTVGPYQNVILTTTVINHGNSGGPLLNEKGELVGMNSAGRTDIVGQNYAVGVDRINEIVPKLLSGQEVCGSS